MEKKIKDTTMVGMGQVQMQQQMLNLQMENMLMKDLIEQLDDMNEWTFDPQKAAFIATPKGASDESEVCDNKTDQD